VSKQPFMTIPVFLLMLAFSSPVHSTQLEQSYGLGLGLPYGGLGVNYELGVNDYFAPTLGLGYLPDNIGWNAGVRFYYPGRDARFRGRLTALYGTNVILKKTIAGNTDYDTQTGMSGGLGFNWRFGDYWSFAVDLFVVENDVPAGYEEKGSEVKFTLGFSRHW
jgi:hypothetical protein